MKTQRKLSAKEADKALFQILSNHSELRQVYRNSAKDQGGNVLNLEDEITSFYWENEEMIRFLINGLYPEHCTAIREYQAAARFFYAKSSVMGKLYKTDKTDIIDLLWGPVEMLENNPNCGLGLLDQFCISALVKNVENNRVESIE